MIQNRRRTRRFTHPLHPRNQLRHNLSQHPNNHRNSRTITIIRKRHTPRRTLNRPISRIHQHTQRQATGRSISISNSPNRNPITGNRHIIPTKRRNHQASPMTTSIQMAIQHNPLRVHLTGHNSNITRNTSPITKRHHAQRTRHQRRMLSQPLRLTITQTPRLNQRRSHTRRQTSIPTNITMNNNSTISRTHKQHVKRRPPRRLNNSRTHNKQVTSRSIRRLLTILSTSSHQRISTRRTLNARIISHAVRKRSRIIRTILQPMQHRNPTNRNTHSHLSIILNMTTISTRHIRLRRLPNVILLQSQNSIRRIIRMRRRHQTLHTNARRITRPTRHVTPSRLTIISNLRMPNVTIRSRSIRIIKPRLSRRLRRLPQTMSLTRRNNNNRLKNHRTLIPTHNHNHRSLPHNLTSNHRHHHSRTLRLQNISNLQNRLMLSPNLMTNNTNTNRLLLHQPVHNTTR